MLCSKCSEPVRPVVAIDIDGTIGNYHGHFMDFAITYWDLRETFPHRNDFGAVLPWDGEGEFEDYIGITKAQYREAKLAYRQGGYKRWLPVYSGAKAGIDRIRSAGAEVWIATTRPWQRLDNIDPDTREWLRRNDISVDGLLYGDDKYQQLVNALSPDRIVAVVEDIPEQFMIAMGLGLPVSLRHNHHNVGSRSKCVPGGSLDACLRWAHGRVAAWIESNKEKDVHT